jgi:hypothetical protein
MIEGTTRTSTALRDSFANPARAVGWPSHEYAHTLRELNVASAKVKRGSLICGDDWTEDKGHVNARVAKGLRGLLARASQSDQLVLGAPPPDEAADAEDVTERRNGGRT